MRAHFNALAASRKAIESFCARFASCVYARRKKVSSAARAAAWSFEVLSITALSQGPNRVFKRVAAESFL